MNNRTGIYFSHPSASKALVLAPKNFLQKMTNHPKEEKCQSKEKSDKNMEFHQFFSRIPSSCQSKREVTQTWNFTNFSREFQVHVSRKEK
jgi:hypothetical protein